MAKRKGIKSVIRNGTTYWYAHVGKSKENGKGRKVSAPAYCGKGPEGERLAKAARAEYVATRYKLRESGAGVRVERSRFDKFTQLANWYLQLREVKKMPSYDRACQGIANLVNYFGKTPLGAITYGDMMAYRERRKSHDVTDRTMDIEISYLSRMFNLAIQYEQVPPELAPKKYAKTPKKEHEKQSPPRRVFTEVEYQRVLEAAEPNFRDVCICAYETSMRSKEIAELRVKQVHINKVVTEVPYQIASYFDVVDAKNGKRKFVPISATLMEVLQRRLPGLEPDDHVFTQSDGEPWTSRDGKIAKHMTRTCKKAGVLYGDRLKDEDGNLLLNEEGRRAGVTFHCFRHTRITLWVEAGFSDSFIRLASGHQDFGSYRDYIKLNAAHVMRLVEPDSKKRIKVDTNHNKNELDAHG